MIVPCERASYFTAGEKRLRRPKACGGGAAAIDGAWTTSHNPPAGFCGAVKSIWVQSHDPTKGERGSRGPRVRGAGTVCEPSRSPSGFRLLPR